MKINTLLLFSLILVVACSEVKKFPELKGDYLGQLPPEYNAEIFAPGIISSALNDRDITFHPNGDEIVYGVLEAPRNLVVSMKRVNGTWQKQEILPICGYYNDIEPQFSPDGKRLYFCSDRPVKEGEEKNDYDIWFVDRNPAGWDEPKNLGFPLNSDKNEFYPSITVNNTIYFTTYDMKIFISYLVEEGYSEPVSVSDSINSGVAEYNAYVSSDESYIIFTSHGWEGGRKGQGDLFISYRNANNVWSKAKKLGSKINSSVPDMCPTVTPDGKYLFFPSRRAVEREKLIPVKSYEKIFEVSNMYGNGKPDIYWVNMSFKNSLKIAEP